MCTGNITNCAILCICQLLSVMPRNKQHNFHNIQLEWIIACMSKFRQGLDSWLCFLTWHSLSVWCWLTFGWSVVISLRLTLSCVLQIHFPWPVTGPGQSWWWVQFKTMSKTEEIWNLSFKPVVNISALCPGLSKPSSCAQTWKEGKRELRDRHGCQRADVPHMSA